MDESKGRIVWVNEDRKQTRVNLGWTEYTRAATPEELKWALNKRIDSYAD